MRSLGNRGDTIVEVLIVIVVISMVMASSYGVAIRSQKANQQTQEHAQALKYSESQLESLKEYVNKNGISLLSQAFCINSTGGLVTGFGAGAPTTSKDTDNFASYPTDCKKSANGGPCTAQPFCYNVAVVKGNGSDTNLYRVTTRWDGINGIHDEVGLVYRLNP